VKPNVCTLGADQFDDKYSRDRMEKKSYFNWYYWFINLGSFIALIFIGHVCQNGLPGHSSDSKDFFYGFLFAAGSMSCALLVFVSGTMRYRYDDQVNGSELNTAMSIIAESCMKYFKEGKEHVGLGSGARHFLDRSKVDFSGSFASEQVEGVKEVLELTPYLIALIPYWCVNTQMYTTFQNQACQMDLNIGNYEIPISGKLLWFC
jgi:peptide/histidine transporter 3/4